jgi:hypothetical protein
MNKFVKIFTWIVIGIMMINSNMHFLNDNSFTFIMIVLLIILITNLILIILKKPQNEKIK